MGRWKMVRLGDVCEIVSGTTPKSNVEEYWNGTENWVTPAELNEDTLEVFETDRKITKLAIKESSLKSFPAGTVLLSSRAPIGKVAIAGTAMYCNQGFKNFICSDKVFNKFLYWFLKGKTDYLNSLGRGATFKEISKSIVQKIELPLPPLDEQKRIAKNLDLASEIVKGYKEQLAELDKLVQSVFYDMFGDIRANSKMWDITPFSYCAKIDTRMTTDFAKYADYPHIGIDSIEKNTGNIISCVLVKDSDLKSGKYLFDDRHLIYSKIRPNLNKVAKPNFEGICSADAYPLLPTKQCNREYLAMVLRSDSFLDYILAFSNRTNIPKVNKSQLESFSLPLPPIDLQTRFASIVTAIETQKAQVQQALTESENLFNSLMQEYFE